jgi:hypothetical protein
MKSSCSQHGAKLYKIHITWYSPLTCDHHSYNKYAYIEGRLCYISFLDRKSNDYTISHLFHGITKEMDALK